MQLKSISLYNFRNIQKLSLQADPFINVFTGENGQGKTNILEAIWLLTGAKSFRAAKDSELIEFEQQNAVIEAKLYDTREKTIRIFISNGEQKGRYAKVNGVDYKKATNIAGELTAVVFAPIHLTLITGSKENRRRFIDSAICQLYPTYISTLRAFTRLLSQKNALLKARTKDSFLLDSFNRPLSEYSAEIAKARSKYIDNLTPITKQFYSEISGEKEQLELAYKAPATTAEQFRELFERSKPADYKMGFSTEGIHRDDLMLTLNDTDAKIYASQGQKRSIALSLKLSEAKNILLKTNEAPLMLLDDVLSELDKSRKHYLLNEIKGKQVFITCCEEEVFNKTKGKIFLVNKGKLK